MAEKKKKQINIEAFDLPEDDFTRRARAKKPKSAKTVKDKAIEKPKSAKAVKDKDVEKPKSPKTVKDKDGEKPKSAKAVKDKDVAKPKKATAGGKGKKSAAASKSKKPSSKPKSPSSKKKRKAKKKKLPPALLAANLLLAAGIAIFAVLGGMLVFKHNSFAEMKRVVEAQTFYDGTTVEGVDVSDMTLNDALAFWRENIEPRYADRVVTLDGAGQVTAVDMGYRSDYEAVLFNAWSAGRRGSLEQRYHAAVSRQYSPVAYDVDRELYTDRAVNSYVQAVAVKADVPAVDAAIESFDAANYTFVLTDSQVGQALDAEGLKRDIIAALEAGGGDVRLNIETVQPSVTKEDVSAEYGMIAYAVTNASSSSSNRIKNIKNAVSIINGTRVADGETFSFNDTVGERTTARGFRRATAYSGGEVTEEIGGGICQVSTTLFNAAVKSDMEIVERHNHSLTVSYVDRGKDAAVNWKSQDLKFTNHSGDDVYICCFVTEDKRVRFALFGRLLPNGETITLEGKTTETIKYDTTYERSAFLLPGETKVVEQGKNGYKAVAYKIRHDAQGNELSRELLCKSSYKSRNEVIQFGR